MSHLKLEALRPETLPLYGCHLIEASAGTGKTYNITRIYLRLLLERKLDVKQILVMTFTRAATEELRGRIAQELRNALNNWEQFDSKDSFFVALNKRFTLQDVYPVLHNALLHLDEAAIFTIHSFCKRVLSQQAFSSGVAFNIQMEADTADIELEAVRDWYRCLSQQPDEYDILTRKWSDPESFRRAFKEVLSSNTAIEIKSPEVIRKEFIQRKMDCLAQLEDNQAIIFSQLVDTHNKKDERAHEWSLLLQWLKDNDIDWSNAMPKQAGQFFSGVRFAKKKPEIKQQLVDVFTPINRLKTEAATIARTIESAQSYYLAAQGFAVIREKIVVSKQQAKVMNYDDLINQLADSLTFENHLAKKIREQYPVALVDEFQDTDPQQYSILNTVYQSHPETNDGSENDATALYMIGDPKQAIYAFRSGDVFTYLAARQSADKQWIMDTNWRSSTKMINGYNRLFYGAALNETAADIFGFGIEYIPVKSAGRADQSALSGVIDNAAMQIIHFPFNEDYRSGKGKKEEMKQDFCPVISAWCASEIHRLLSNEVHIGEQSLQEQDIAVLVRDKTEAGYIQDALREAGYPSVYLSTHDNVFVSEEALELQRVLVSILELENDRAMVAGLSTRFIGCDTEQLFLLQEDELQWENYRERLFDLRETWFKRGFMAMALKLLHQNYRPNPNYHERSLTNSIQLLELLQQASQRHRQPEQLLDWFREQIENQGVESEAELRLESDANLIRIVTQHGSKGLEYPVVFIPFACRYKDPTRFASRNIDLFKYHERETLQLKYFVGQDKTITELYREEAWAESIRLLYVAITRAEHRCYICATPFANYHLSSLGQTLQLKSGDDLYQGLYNLLEPDNQAINIQQIHEMDFPVTRIEAIDSEEKLSAAFFNGRIERNWWLSSFSALTRNLRHGGISTPDRDQDEISVEVMPQLITKDDIRFSLKKGAAAGNLLHDILEHTDFTQPHWQRSLERPLTRFSEALDQVQQRDLVSWMEDCLDTPLPDIQEYAADVEENHLKLNQLHWSHTLRESEFYFPMQQVKPHALGQLLARHRGKYTETISLPGHQALQGMMHGFIDLVFQWQGRFYIADYKSTHLGYHLDCYDRKSLAKNIRDNYYDLQYLLYSLALHRYLKSRLPEYDPAQHFGGVYYFYLRGMSRNSDTGIFYTDISSELLDELDRLFAQQTVEAIQHV